MGNIQAESSAHSTSLMLLAFYLFPSHSHVNLLNTTMQATTATPKLFSRMLGRIEMGTVTPRIEGLMVLFVDLQLLCSAA
jgi:hypothetical protein